MRESMKRLVFVSLLAVVVFGLAVSVIVAQPEQGAPRKIVVFQEGFVNEPAQQVLIERLGGVVIKPLPLVNGMAVLLPPRALDALGLRPEVLRVEDDAVVVALAKPPKPPPSQLPETLSWGVDRIDAEYAWPSGYTGAGVKVAVVDTGIDLDHPDLMANIKGQVNCINPSKTGDDDNGHGTHVAGIVAAIDNDIGVIGVAPQAELYAVKVLSRRGSGFVSDIIEGITWCINNGMDIINMSLGTDTDIQSLHDACDEAAAAGLLLVAAAGNDGGAVDYPGAYDSVIAVAATDSSDNRASWSSFGIEMDIAAPGVEIYSTWKGGGYATASGTSMAAPHVAGTLALNLSANICATADDLGASGWDIYTGCGLVDAEQAAIGTESGDN